ncbi:MAG: serine/threonine protein kinase [bacterium]|nr:serine/threonine protein kinase [bacterium]
MEQKFGKYLVKEELGRGAMGIVYLAYDPVLERDVAIKTISSSIREDHLKKRFIREARAAGKLTHSNIVTVYDFGMEGDRLFIAMEFLRGRDLSQLISNKSRIDIKEKLEIIRQICLGLDYAHRHSVFHRDIKPANVLLRDDGHVKIVDFGLAMIHTSSLTHSGALLGTPNYTSPERLQGENSDGKTDQFAVGILLYEILTYCRAFSGDSISSIMFNILNSEPLTFTPHFNSRYPELERIVKKALMKKPEMRYDSMEDMAAAIEAVIYKMKQDDYVMTSPITVSQSDFDSEATEATEAVTTSMVKNIKRSHWLPIAILFATVGLVLTGLYYFTRQSDTQIPTISLKKAPLHVRKTTLPLDKPGIIAFDMKPYAVIQEIKHIRSGETIPVPGDGTTPINLSLEAGTYTIVYTFPREQDRREKKVTVFQGKTTILKDRLSDSFVEEAVKHFLVAGE